MAMAMANIQLTEEQLNEMIDTRMNARLAQMFSPEQLDQLNKIGTFDAQFQQIRGRITQVEENLSMNVFKVEQALPDITAKTNELAEAQQKVTESMDHLNRRDLEVSNKLKDNFSQVDHKMSEVGEQAARVASMQESIHAVIVKQKIDLEGVKTEVETFVRNAMASVGPSASGADHLAGKGGFDDGRNNNAGLNNPTNSEVDTLSDDMTKAKFVLWRENLDFHLKGFKEFGHGIGQIL